jgi:hypothetical protein
VSPLTGGAPSTSLASVGAYGYVRSVSDHKLPTGGHPSAPDLPPGVEDVTVRTSGTEIRVVILTPRAPDEVRQRYGFTPAEAGGAGLPGTDTSPAVFEAFGGCQMFWVAPSISHRGLEVFHFVVESDSFLPEMSVEEIAGWFRTSDGTAAAATSVGQFLGDTMSHLLVVFPRGDVTFVGPSSNSGSWPEHGL